MNPKTIFLSIAGSQSYGINTNLSDLDLKGICMLPEPIRNDLFTTVEQYENPSWILEKYAHLKNPLNPKIEGTLYVLKKYMILAAGGNPNILELLFVDKKHILELSSGGERLINNRHLFISQKCKDTYVGYAFSQIKRIERHRKWILKGDIKEPRREDYGLKPEKTAGIGEVERYLAKYIGEWNFCDLNLEQPICNEIKLRTWQIIKNISGIDIDEGNWLSHYNDALSKKIISELNISDKLAENLDNEIKYKNAFKEYNSWITWKKERNAERHALEVKCGYDSKHAAHCIRLLRSGKEILTHGYTNTLRNDAQELLEIRNGNWTYEKVEEEANKILTEIKTLKSSLPKDVDRAKVNELYLDILDT